MKRQLNIIDDMALSRLEDPLEVLELGVDEQVFGDGVWVVEWADKAADLFPEESCWIALDYGPVEDSRTVVVSASSDRFGPVFDRLAAAFSTTEEVV